MFTATFNLPGCLPEADPVECDTATEGWLALTAAVDVTAEDLLWTPVDADDPDGEVRRSSFADALQDMAERNTVGAIYGPDGYVYSVAVTEPVRVAPGEVCHADGVWLYGTHLETLPESPHGPVRYCGACLGLGVMPRTLVSRAAWGIRRGYSHAANLLTLAPKVG